MVGKIKNFALKIDQLRVYKGDNEVSTERNTYINGLNDFASKL